DPGHPEVCSVFDYHKIFSVSELPEIDSGCRGATLGCVDCKKKLAENVNQLLDPFRERRAQLEREPKRVREIINQGNLRAQTVAESTMAEVRRAMHLPE
ncbi:tryptophan--tRNA ligase, partial [bacterium]|nr:tryptophan--tRNA ligase [bacterium]